VAAWQPDVVLTDLAMPDLDGASTTRALPCGILDSVSWR
jgi:CheY-like chemotaxis protein